MKVKRHPWGRVGYFPYLRVVIIVDMQALTVDELYRALAIARRDGFGSKKILLSNDEEQNGYHECFFQVCTNPEALGLSYNDLPYGVEPEDLDNYVIIG